MRAHRGFTLVEMLVVVTMLVILSVSVALTLRPVQRDTVAHEAERLARLLELALEQSRVTGNRIVWVPAASGYRFAALNRGEDTGFATPAMDARLGPRELHSGMTVASVSSDGRDIAANASISLAGAAPAPFAIRITGDGGKLLLEGSVLGRVSIRPAVPAP